MATLPDDLYVQHIGLMGSPESRSSCCDVTVAAAPR